jgi:hypothetical protein
MGMNFNGKNKVPGRGGHTEKNLCQLCGIYFFYLSAHVRNKHGSTITDLIVEGKWKNERNPEH